MQKIPTMQLFSSVLHLADVVFSHHFKLQIDDFCLAYWILCVESIKKNKIAWIIYENMSRTSNEICSQPERKQFK